MTKNLINVALRNVNVLSVVCYYYKEEKREMLICFSSQPAGGVCRCLCLIDSSWQPARVPVLHRRERATKETHLRYSLHIMGREHVVSGIEE